MSVSSNWGRRPEVAAAPTMTREVRMTVLACRESFAYIDGDGNQAFVQEGDTLNDDHPVVRGREHMFEPFTVTHESAAVEPKKARRI